MLIREDEEHVSEARYNVLGKVGKVLFVVCMFVSDERIRIISARLATSSERRRYDYGENIDE